MERRTDKIPSPCVTGAETIGFPSVMNARENQYLKVAAMVTAAVVAYAISACRRNAEPEAVAATPPETLPAATAGGNPGAGADAVAKTPSPEPLRVETPSGMLPVPGGTFKMGLSDRGIPDEQPAHAVTVDGFLLDTTEVSNAAYQKCVDAGVCRRPAYLDTVKSGFEPLERFRTPDRPVNGVSHEDAATYCKFVGKRLPREAEWERAARGDDARLYPWGNDPPSSKRAVFRAKVTKPVGSLPLGKGPYGHMDLAGNVWEWVQDHYDPYAYRRSTVDRGIPGDCGQILATQRELKRKGLQGFTGTNPIPVECEYVLRGGAFNYFPWGLRSSNRVHHAGRFRIAMAGFRCAKDIP
jgi:formylglycine-generating enzyme required for sulfatase activity